MSTPINREATAPMSDVRLAFDVKAQLGEGPIWDSARQRLLFVDILRGHVHAYDPVTTHDRIYEVGQPVGAVACTTRGDWVVALGGGIARLDPESGHTTAIVAAEPGPPVTRMNDGYVDPAGRFWAGTMSMQHEAGRGTLYCLAPDGQLTRKLAPVTTSNGIDWSPDTRLMYYVDTRTGRIDVFDFDVASGEAENRRPFAVVPESDGFPDGLVVDAEGGVWLALWRGASVRRYLPDGRLDRVIPLPVSLTTKCAFAGPNLEDLYVTSAWVDLNPAERAAQPAAGGLFHVKPGVRGKPAFRFAG